MGKTKVITTLLLTLAISVMGCNKDENKSVIPKLSDEQITLNLAEHGKNDIELLVGEWNVTKFAYTMDGKRISNVKDISNLGFENNPADKGFLAWYTIQITDGDVALMISDAPSGLFGPLTFGTQNHFYSISGNSINFSRFSDNQYAINLKETDDVYDVLFALKNTYSFVIKGKELIIYFTGIENKNLLILKKR